MVLRPTKISKLGDVILTRHCSIEGPDGEISPLILSFIRPKRIDDDTVEQSLRFQCKYFDEVETLSGGDDVQVLTYLFEIGRIRLEHWEKAGYSIWFHQKGDLDFFDFWSYQQKPWVFSLKSAFHFPALEAFEEANKGKFLTPSHRVAVDSERPCVQIYEVRPDGSDVVGAMIGPDKIAAMTTDDLCHEIGRTVLFSSREGRRLLGLGPIEDQIRADVEASEKGV